LFYYYIFKDKKPLSHLLFLVTYVVGLGDRHLNNILINKTTGELIHIDLGMIFEYSKRVLPIPEKVPFRLTRDMVDPILVEGVNGRFKHVAIHALSQLQQNSQVLIGIASLLLHDPISSFGGDVKVEGAERNMLAETAISRLRSKLEGRDLSIVNQTAEQQVINVFTHIYRVINIYEKKPM
jgi:ataxia telangiectasia mutated family protein